MELLDAIIVGAGFSGVRMLHCLRSVGLSVKIFESESNFGGKWHSNSYPGARVDCEFYVYQFSDSELYKEFNYTEKCPSRAEVLTYFEHMDKVLSLRKDVHFNTKVLSAEFHDDMNSWEVKSTAGTTWCRNLILCTGFASKPYSPTFPGADKFKGEILHSSNWPKSKEIQIEGKRVGVIGTGPSGIQIIQEIGPSVDHLTVFQRTPNMSFPMQQCKLPNPDLPEKGDFEELFAKGRSCLFGYPADIEERNAVDCTQEERQKLFERLHKKGGLAFFLENFPDILVSKKANDMAYNFWAEKTRSRVNCAKKKDILAPLIPPHPFNAKRPSLEQNYYEIFNQDNVDIIDVNVSPIIEITPNGIKSRDEGEVDLDVIVLATGFDAVTGGIFEIDIKNVSTGETLQDKWKNGVTTFLGMTCAGFPNMFLMYGPQSPAALSNGPTIIEIQADWLTRLIVLLKKQGKTKVEADREAEKPWRDLVHLIWNSTLLPQAKSYWQGANIPGKPVEPLFFLGGVPAYVNALRDCEDNEYKGLIMN